METYKLRVKLEGLAVERVLEVPTNFTFDKLHKVIQVAFGWLNYHLYEFEYTQDLRKIGLDYSLIYILTNDEEAIDQYRFFLSDEGKEYLKTMPEEFKQCNVFDESRKVMNSNKIKVGHILKKGEKFKYTYDFGDDWEHTIEVLDYYELDRNYAQVLEGHGACPPEDVGGVPGYKNFLKIINNPNHKEYEEMKDWANSQNYEDFNLEKVNIKLKGRYK